MSPVPVQVNASPIPSDWVITPFGYTLSQCVYDVGNYAHVFGNGTLAMRDGKKLTPAACPYTQSSGIVAPVTTGWVEDAGWISSSPIQNFSGYWGVPSPPSNNDNQVIYLFIGLEPLSGAPIAQPVLQWGFNGKWGGAYWEFESWVYLDNNNYAIGNRYHVNGLDTIYGLVEGSVVWNNSFCNPWPVQASCACKSSSCTWWVYTWDVNQPSDNFSLVSSEYCSCNTPVTMQWAFSALEVANLVFCADYPASGVTLFQNLSLKDTNGNVLTPAWQADYYPTTDHCVQKVIINGPSYATLQYGFGPQSGTGGGGGGCSRIKQGTIASTPKPC